MTGLRIAASGLFLPYPAGGKIRIKTGIFKRRFLLIISVFAPQDASGPVIYSAEVEVFLRVKGSSWRFLELLVVTDCSDEYL